MAKTGKGLPRSLVNAEFSAAWGDVTGKPATFTPTIGTTSTTAMAGNKAPTTTQRGGVLQQPAIDDPTGDITTADFVNLLNALRAAGVLAS